MKITDTADYVRQQELGQFSRPEDRKEPFVHVNDQKLDSTKEQEERSVYIDNEKVATLEKEIGSYSYYPKFFDFDIGIKVNTEKISETHKEKEGKLNQQYDKTGKAQSMNKQEGLFDQLA